MEEFHQNLFVSITGTTTSSDGDGNKYTLFTIHVSSSYGVYDIPRRYRQFNALHIELTQASSKLGVNLPSFPGKQFLGTFNSTFIEERRHALQEYLSRVCEIQNVLSLEPLVRFLELTMSLRMAIMTQDISSAFKEIRANESALEDIQHRLTVVEKQVKQNEQQLRRSPNHENYTHNFRALANDSRYDVSLLPSGEVLEHKLSGDGSPLSPKHGYFIAQILGIEQETALIEKHTGPSIHSSDQKNEDDTHHMINNELHDVSKMKLNFSSVDEQSQEVKQKILDKLGPSSNETDISQLETLADEIVFLMQPQEPQIKYRLSASKYISHRARKTLGALTYEIGLQALRCFLPDDPIRMSVFMSRSHEAGWYVRLNEQMCRLSGGLTSSQDGDSPSSTGTHVLSNVSFVSNNEMPGHKLQCLVDSSLGVEILANVRLELCLVAFFEEFDRLLGRDHLFKRSVILIRTWWVYEANMSSSCGISDSAFCVMILSILNRFHTRIYCPFQTLCYFMAEYSSLNFSRNVISIYGPIEVDSYMKTNFTDQSNYLITSAILNRYRKLTLAVDEDESITMELLNETIGDDSLSDAVFVARRLKAHSDEVKTVCPFDMKPIMIAHPLLPGMLFDCPTPILRRKSGFIVESFRKGAKALVSLLGVDDNSGEVHQHTLMDTFFKNSIARFGRGWRPDSPPPSWVNNPDNAAKAPSQNATILSDKVDRWSVDSCSPLVSVDLSRESSFNRSEHFTMSDTMTISLDKTVDRIKYCNLILESQISEPALKALSRLVLTEKGPLPVGEIGKMLQDACSVVTAMSTVLKERFGGLKKFLERHADDFVMANDHPFNPTVYLKDMISPEDLKTLKRGEAISRTSIGSLSTSSNSKIRNRRNSRTSLSRKKSPAPTLPLSPDQYPLSHAPITSSSRTMSSNALDLSASGVGVAPLYSSVLVGGDNAGLGIASPELDGRGRTMSTPNQQKNYDLQQSLGVLGIPDPNAPEFIPNWGPKMK